MVGILTQRCSACCDCDGVRDARAHRSRRRRSCRRSVSVKRAGFHLMGSWSRSLRVSFVSADWRLGVFCLSGLVDRPSNLLYLRNIPLSGCMGRRSHYSHLFSLEVRVFINKSVGFSFFSHT